MEAKKVFISHSTKDAEKARRICELLEAEGIACWIAPRDIPVGERYSAVIVEAIESCEGFVLVYSRDANESKYVYAEVEIAFKGKRIFPTKLENVKPNRNLEFFLSLLQCHDASTPPFEDKLREFTTQIKAYFMDRPPEFAGTAPSSAEVRPDTASKRAHKRTISDLIPAAVQPIAAAMGDLREAEISKDPTPTEIILFRLVNRIARMAAFCLLAAYRASFKESGEKPDPVLAGIASPETGPWIKVILHLTGQLKGRPDLAPDLIRFLDFLGADNSEIALAEAIGEVKPCLRPFPALQASEKSPLALLDILAQYEIQYQHRGVRAKDAAEKIRDAMIWLVGQCEFPFLSPLLGVESFKLNRKKSVFEHQVVRFNGLVPAPVPDAYPTPIAEVMDAGQVFLLGGEKGGKIDLAPFLRPAEGNADLLAWMRTEDFNRIEYEKVGDKTLKEAGIDHDPLIESLKGLGKPENGARQENIWTAFKEAESHLRAEVKNPLLLNDCLGRLKSLEEQFEAEMERPSRGDLAPWLDKIAALQSEATKGSFTKLLPGEKDYLLTDEHNGVYVVVEKFLEAHPGLGKALERERRLLAKAATKEVQVMLMLAVQEAERDGYLGGMGVEHVMVALSKLCNRLVMDWYAAIGVPPKYHRDLVRMAMEARNRMGRVAKGVETRMEIKPRLKHVLEMAEEEANLAKRDAVNLVDVHSAILREGRSLPIQVLVQVFDMTRDRLLGEFYHLLRKA